MTHKADNLDLGFVDQVIEGNGPDGRAGLGKDRRSAIPILQALQDHYGYLSEEALHRVCEITDITPAQIAGVASFYTQFRHEPMGKHLVRVCAGTACHVKGSPAVREAIYRHLHIAADQDTDEAGQFTVQKVACLGCCTLAPVVQIDNVTYGHLTSDGVAGIFRDFEHLQANRHVALAAASASTNGEGEIRVGLGSCCLAKGSGNVQQALVRAVDELGITARIKPVGCVGMCHQTPLLEILPANKPSALYARVQPEDVKEILQRHFASSSPVRRAALKVSGLLDKLLTDQTWRGVERFGINHRDEPVSAFLSCQHHVATEHCGQIDPTDLDEYLSRDGFTALRHALAQESERVIQSVLASGLRGRGGAGFPTGLKWELVRNAAGAPKYVICNGDEGDPGAFMDRMLLESYPYRVIEGVLIAAHAVGASKAVFYIRAEYPLAVERIGQAIQRLQAHHLWGELAKTAPAVEMEIFQGAGAFVCGEETALIASVQGERGMPVLRPPFPAQQGLFGKPTLVNNTETLAMLPWIFRNGPERFSALGSAASKGTKVFALAGKVARGGLIEVPMGMTIRRIVMEVGGGVADGKRFKAVQIGGPSGGCVPESLSDTPVDYEALTRAGAIMGSGGLVVLDESDCMVEIARYFLEFTQDQSCGKCTFCRVGTRRMLDILERLCTGKGRSDDLQVLEELGHMVQRGSLCGLGRTAPNPVLSTLKYFRSEYEAHLAGKCPAGKCRTLTHYRITDDCIGCTKCAQHCPADAIAFRPYEKHEIDQEKCTRCDTCRAICPADAVVVE